MTVIILVELDERFREERNRQYLSKWMRKTLKEYNSFDSSLEGLKSFFKDVKVLAMLASLVHLYIHPLLLVALLNG